MEIFIYYLLFSIGIGFVSYAFWCYSYTHSVKTSSFYNYMYKNDAYEWIFLCALLWPLTLLGLIFIVIILVAWTITKWIRYKFGINE